MEGVEILCACKLLILERETGVEPATSSLGSWHSTTELLPLACQISYLPESVRLPRPTYSPFRRYLSHSTRLDAKMDSQTDSTPAGVSGPRPASRFQLPCCPSCDQTLISGTL